MKIKNVTLKNNLILAPMAGVTDFAFRKLAKDFGAGLTVTEMVSARALKYGSKNTLPLLYFCEDESPKAVQLFGHSPDDFEWAIKSGLLDKFDIIDINMGCPAPKITKNKDGSALLLDFDNARKIVETCVNCTDKPITVKMRKSYYDGGEEALELCQILESAGASAITIHGRTRPQMYSGNVDLEFISKVKNVLKIPVIGNGDVCDQNTLNEMLATNVDAVMIGRGALGKPWIFEQLSHNNCPNIDKFKIICEHIDILSEKFSPQYLNKYMRKHILWYLKDEVNAKSIKQQIVACDDLDQVLAILKSYFRGNNEKSY